MTRYVALLRGIGPVNPNMKNENYRRVAESVGLSNVSTVISTGNVIFDSDSDDAASLESTLEDAWLSELGFQSTTIIRTGNRSSGLSSLSHLGASTTALPPTCW